MYSDMKTKEQIETAKRVPIVAVLASYGITSPKVKGTELVFGSPFRPDTTPSFSVDITKNVWIDFGQTNATGKDYEGGSVVDLVMKVEKVNFPNAIDRLLNFDGLYTSINHYQGHPEKQRKLELLSTSKDFHTPDNFYLAEYAQSRGIGIETLMTFCEVVIYKNKGNGKIYRAIGFKNDVGGYELRYQNQARNEGFKGCLGKKEISSVQNWNLLKTAYVFEGFFDFLSWIEYTNRDDNKLISPVGNIFVLNTLAIANRIDYKKYSTVHCFFDNDIGGITTYKKLSELHKNVNFVNASSNLFPKHNDFNDFLIWQQNKRSQIEER